ncbi:hypothetical protein B0H14DRAFT_2394941, partial [Mycena olivaceomarginata]
DKMTTFWTAYEKLADEFDKELQKKYGNDLDTSLIFVGTSSRRRLFSAVSSAFVIQIQPELQPDPNPATQNNPPSAPRPERHRCCSSGDTDGRTG